MNKIIDIFEKLTQMLGDILSTNPEKHHHLLTLFVGTYTPSIFPLF